MLIPNKGQMVRTRVKEIRETGRKTMGVKLMDLRNGEKHQAIAQLSVKLRGRSANLRSAGRTIIAVSGRKRRRTAALHNAST